MVEKIKAEIERLIKNPRLDEEYNPAYQCGLRDLRSFIESLEKEPAVDLEKEIQSFWNANALEYRLGHIADIHFLAYTTRHFYELGKNARKEE